MAQYSIRAYNYSQNNLLFCCSYKFTSDTALAHCVIGSLPFPMSRAGRPGEQTFRWDAEFAFATIQHMQVGNRRALVTRMLEASLHNNKISMVIQDNFVHWNQPSHGMPEGAFIIDTASDPMPWNTSVGMSTRNGTACCMVENLKPNSSYLFKPTGPLSVFTAPNFMVGDIIPASIQSSMFDIDFAEGQTELEVSFTPQQTWQRGRMH